MAVLSVAAGVLILAACGGTSVSSPVASTTTTGPGATTPTPTSPSSTLARSAGECADVIGAELVEAADGTYQVSATVSSADTGDEKYADEWRVVTSDGTVLGVRVLTHPHVNEQPFTRSLSGVEIGPEVDAVTIEARDSVEGYCGDAVSVEVP